MAGQIINPYVPVNPQEVADTNIINVGPEVIQPTHDVQLTDMNGTTVGLILSNPNGSPNPRGMLQGAMPRTAMQTSQGGTGYDDMEMPFTVEVQTSMIGGRAQDDFSKDKTRYADGFRMDTTGVFPIMGPAVDEQSGYMEAELAWGPNPTIYPNGQTTLDPDIAPDGAYNVTSLYHKYIVTGTKTFTGISWFLKGWTGALTIYYGFGSVNAVTGYYDLPNAVTVYGTGQDKWVYLPTPPKTVTNAVVTWGFNTSKRVYSWKTVPDPAISSWYHPGGNVSLPWTEYLLPRYTLFTSKLHFNTQSDYKFFEYKRQLYMFRNGLDKQSGAIYMNGYRGGCLSNASNLNELRTGLTLVKDELKGAVAMITNGPGELEDQPWREIVSNDTAGVITVSSPWKQVQTTASEYVILGTNKWSVVDNCSFDKAITSVIEAEEYLVVSFGEAKPLKFVKQALVASVWTTTVYTSTNANHLFHYLALTQDTQGKSQLWAANANSCQVTFARLPAFGSDPVFDIWVDERLELTKTKARIEADLIPVADPAVSVRLNRQKADLQLLVARLNEDIAAAKDEELERRLNRQLRDANTQKAYLLADIASAEDLVLKLRLQRELQDANNTVARLQADIAAVSDQNLERKTLRDHDKLTLEITRLNADKVGKTGDELLRINRLIEDATTNLLYANKDLGHSPYEADSILIDPDTLRDLNAQLTDAQLAVARITYDLTQTTDPINLLRLTRERDATIQLIADITQDLTLTTSADLLTKLNRDKADALLSIARIEEDLVATLDPATQLRYQRELEDIIFELSELKYYLVAGNTSSHINNMIIYGSPGVPYIIKEDEIGSIYENVYSKIPIAEISAVKSEKNGRAVMAYGVYLYFNLEGGWIERYYDQRMDDVSPNRDEGLPTERQGEVSKLMPYPGRWYAAINAGPQGTSSVLCNNELGWHEIYRSPSNGLQITDIYVQTIPGVSTPDRLWVAEGNFLSALSIHISPLKQNNYRYFGYKVGANGPSIETSWIDFGFKDVNKYFHSINLFTDMPNKLDRTGYEYEIFVSYQTDTMSSNQWVSLGRRFAKTQNEYFIVNNGKHNVAGKAIKFRLSFNSYVEYYTPRLKSIVVNGVVRFPTKNSWNLTFQLNPDHNLQNTPIQTHNPNRLYNQLQIWANSELHATPLWMKTNDVISNNKLIFIDPLSITRPTVELDSNRTTGKKKFISVGVMTMYEV